MDEEGVVVFFNGLWSFIKLEVFDVLYNLLGSVVSLIVNYFKYIFCLIEFNMNNIDMGFDGVMVVVSLLKFF